MAVICCYLERVSYKVLKFHSKNTCCFEVSVSLFDAPTCNKSCILKLRIRARDTSYRKYSISRTKCDFDMRQKFLILYPKDYMFGSHHVNFLILGRATISKILTISQTALITASNLSIDYSYIYFLIYYYFSDSGYHYFFVTLHYYHN